MPAGASRFLAPWECICSIETKVADLEKLKDAEKLADKAFRDVTAVSHSHSDRSPAVREYEVPGKEIIALGKSTCWRFNNGKLFCHATRK